MHIEKQSRIDQPRKNRPHIATGALSNSKKPAVAFVTLAPLAPWAFKL